MYVVVRFTRCIISSPSILAPPGITVTLLFSSTGFYEGRPDRYFDNKSDPRNARQEVEDSDYTRQVCRYCVARACVKFYKDRYSERVISDSRQLYTCVLL